MVMEQLPAIWACQARLRDSYGSIKSCHVCRDFGAGPFAQDLGRYYCWHANMGSDVDRSRSGSLPVAED